MDMLQIWTLVLLGRLVEANKKFVEIRKKVQSMSSQQLLLSQTDYCWPILIMLWALCCARNINIQHCFCPGSIIWVPSMTYKLCLGCFSSALIVLHANQYHCLCKQNPFVLQKSVCINFMSPCSLLFKLYSQTEPLKLVISVCTDCTLTYINSKFDGDLILIMGHFTLAQLRAWFRNFWNECQLSLTWAHFECTLGISAADLLHVYTSGSARTRLTILAEPQADPV